MSLAVWLGAVRKCSAAVVGLDLVLGRLALQTKDMNKPTRVPFITTFNPSLPHRLYWTVGGS